MNSDQTYECGDPNTWVYNCEFGGYGRYYYCN